MIWESLLTEYIEGTEGYGGPC